MCIFLPLGNPKADLRDNMFLNVKTKTYKCQRITVNIFTISG